MLYAIIVCFEGLLEVYQVHGSNLSNCRYYPLDAVLCQGNNRQIKSFVMPILRRGRAKSHVFIDHRRGEGGT